MSPLAQANSLMICPSSSFLESQRSQGNRYVSFMNSSFTSMQSRCHPEARPGQNSGDTIVNMSSSMNDAATFTANQWQDTPFPRFPQSQDQRCSNYALSEFDSSIVEVIAPESIICEGLIKIRLAVIQFTRDVVCDRPTPRQQHSYLPLSCV